MRWVHSVDWGYGWIGWVDRGYVVRWVGYMVEPGGDGVIV